MLSLSVCVVSYRNSTSNHNSYVGRKASGPVVSYRNSTSNHNCWVLRRICLALYLIEILHQTTTFGRHFPSNDSCILSKFYIKPQLTRIRPYSAIVVSYRNSTSNHNLARQQVVDEVLYLIEILHQTTTLKRGPFKAVGLYLIEILHQTTTKAKSDYKPAGCILSKFYIKPQQPKQSQHRTVSCILSKFYIKPQRQGLQCCTRFVVSYRNSTSNHNNCMYNEIRSAVVSYRNSTSNHNYLRCYPYQYVLYLIEILHQTTTLLRVRPALQGCILSKFYIKPQLHSRRSVLRTVVSYRNSTSNHNCSNTLIYICKLYLIEILHQTTTFSFLLQFLGCCILSKFYIKPQPCS